MTKIMILGVALVGGVLFATAAAAQKAYKCVDEKGSTVYSQTPCVTGSEAQVDISPAHKSRGGYTGRSPYDDPRTVSRESAQQQYKDEAYRRQKAQEEARQKRLAELQAECNRNRGTDCNNPQALRYQESQNIPGGYRR